jgi:hypothetical protein
MSQVLKLISVMLIGIVLVAATCSIDEKSEDDTTLLEQVDPLFKIRAENALLTLADLPRNWTSEPYEEDGIDARIRSSELTITGFGATSKGIRLTMTIPLAGTIMVDAITGHHERMVSSLTYAYPVGTSPDSDSNALVGGLLNVIINRLEQAHQ